MECKAMLLPETANGAKVRGIVCNAGAQVHGPVTYSADGYEETFAGKRLGHFLLVNLLLDLIATDGRIVWTAGGTHDPALLDNKSVGKAVEPDANSLALQGRDGKPISGGRRYATSKLCIIMYGYELDRRLRRAGKPIASIAAIPGRTPFPADSCSAGRNNLISDNYFTLHSQQLTHSPAQPHAIFIMGVGMSIRHARGCSASRAV